MYKLGWLVDDRRIWSDSKGPDHIGPYLSNLENGIVSRISWISMSRRAKTNPRPQFNLIYMIIHNRNWAFVKFSFIIKFNISPSFISLKYISLYIHGLDVRDRGYRVFAKKHHFWYRAHSLPLRERYQTEFKQDENWVLYDYVHINTINHHLDFYLSYGAHPYFIFCVG